MGPRRDIRQGRADVDNRAERQDLGEPTEETRQKYQEILEEKVPEEIKEINCGTENITLADSKTDNFWKSNIEDEIIPYKAHEGILLISEMQIRMVVCFL